MWLTCSQKNKINFSESVSLLLILDQIGSSSASKINLNLPVVYYIVCHLYTYNNKILKK